MTNVASWLGGAVLSPDGAMLAYLPPPVGYVVGVLDLASGDSSRFEMPGGVGRAGVRFVALVGGLPAAWFFASSTG